MTRKARLPARGANPLGLGSTINLKSHEEYPTYSTSASSSSNARYFSNARSHLTSKTSNGGQHPFPVSAPNGNRQGGYHRAMGMHRGSYATLASFTNVPVDGVSAPVLTESSQRDQREYERRKNFSSAWLQQYGNKPQQGQSIWSAQTNGFTRTRSNTLASQSRGRDVMRGASSQLTLFSNCQDTLASQHRPVEVVHPQKNCLVLENGMLRLSPQKAKSTENLMDSRDDAMTRADGFDPFSASTKGTAGAAAREYLLSSQPFYANIPGNTRRSTRRHSRTPYNNTLHRSHDDLYSDANHPPYEQPFELRRGDSPTPVPAIASPITPEGDVVPADPYLNSDIYSHLMPQNFKKPKPKREAKQRAREAQGQGQSSQRSTRRREQQQQAEEAVQESRQERRRRRTNEHTESLDEDPNEMPRAESVLV